jgi:hypothetical protein
MARRSRITQEDVRRSPGVAGDLSALASTRLKGYPAASASAVYFFGSLSKFALQPAEQK